MLKKGEANHLDSCVRPYIKKVYVIEIKLGLQFIYYKDLHDSPHYSVKYNEFCEIKSIAKQSNIPMEFFGTVANHCQPKSRDVMVVNLFEDEDQLFHHLQYTEILSWMKKGKGLDKKRHVKAKHIAPSPSMANGWESTIIGHNVVKKPGYSSQIDLDHRLAVGRGLGLLGTKLVDIMKGEDVHIFQDKERNVEFSNVLANKLNCKHNVFFEGVSVQCLQNGLSIHVDTQNDNVPGYNWSGVLAMTRNGTRLTYNGYTQKCARHYMKRLREARCL